MPPTDAELLATFTRDRSEGAFAELVRRHGPLVQGVCRRVLAEVPEADDAFQAVFLVLAQKAGRLRDPARLGPWLYGVAVRVAGKAKVARQRRQRRERPMIDTPAPQRESDWADVRPLLDGEVARLPDKLRTALVLCELQGVSRDQAAGQLGVPAGTLSSRLARAKDVLRARLTRRGLTLSAAGLGLVLSEAGASAAVPTELVHDTAAAAAAASPQGSSLVGKLLLALVASGGVVGAAVVLHARLRPDWDALQGEWVVERSVNEYSPFTRPEPVFGRRLVIAGDTLTPDPQAVGGTLAIKLDPLHSPRRIDLTASGVRGLANGQVVPGVYEVSGDVLTLNLAMTAGQSRPADPDTVHLYTRSGVTADIGDPAHASRQYVLRRVRPGETTELAGLFGRWRVVGPPPKGPTEFRFNGEHLLMTYANGREPESYRITLDAGRIDLAEHGVNLMPKPGSRPRLGVYEPDGDRLAIRWDSGTRPADLTSPGPAVFRLERVGK